MHIGRGSPPQPLKQPAIERARTVGVSSISDGYTANPDYSMVLFWRRWSSAPSKGLRAKVRSRQDTDASRLLDLVGVKTGRDLTKEWVTELCDLTVHQSVDAVQIGEIA